MGEDSLVPKAKKTLGSPTFVAALALILGAGGASAITITFGGEGEAAKSVTSYEMESIKKTQDKHDARISQNEQGMITVRIAITGIEKEMKSQTEKIDDIKDTVKRIDERSRNGRRNRDE